MTAAYNYTSNLWAAVFFQSTDFKTWNYVPGSAIIPTGSQTLIGNGTLIIPTSGTYSEDIMFYTFINPTSNRIQLWTCANTGASTEMSSWTVQSTEVLGYDCFDFNANINPVTGNVEALFMNSASPREVCMAISTNGGVSYAANSVIVSGDWWNVTNLAEPSIWYGKGPDGSSNYRYVSFDSSYQGGHRFNALCGAAYISGTTWAALAPLGILQVPNSNNAWEAGQTFDMVCKGTFDIGDGNGPSMWAVYSGSNGYDPTSPVSPDVFQTGIAHLGSASMPAAIKGLPTNSGLGNVLIRETGHNGAVSGLPGNSTLGRVLIKET